MTKHFILKRTDYVIFLGSLSLLYEKKSTERNISMIDDILKKFLVSVIDIDGRAG